MRVEAIYESEAFRRFVGAELANGERDLSPEELVDEWRQLHPTPEQAATDLAVIRAAVRDMENGQRNSTRRLN